MFMGREGELMRTISYPAIVPFSSEINYDEHIRKAQALKVLEEASELVEAVKEKTSSYGLYELCDVLQALGNLAAVMGWSDRAISKSYDDVKRANTERGRYGDDAQ